QRRQAGGHRLLRLERSRQRNGGRDRALPRRSRGGAAADRGTCPGASPGAAAWLRQVIASTGILRENLYLFRGTFGSYRGLCQECLPRQTRRHDGRMGAPQGAAFFRVVAGCRGAGSDRRAAACGRPVGRGGKLASYAAVSGLGRRRAEPAAEGGGRHGDRAALRVAAGASGLLVPLAGRLAGPGRGAASAPEPAPAAEGGGAESWIGAGVAALPSACDPSAGCGDDCAPPDRPDSLDGDRFLLGRVGAAARRVAVFGEAALAVANGGWACCRRGGRNCGIIFQPMSVTCAILQGTNTHSAYRGIEWTKTVRRRSASPSGRSRSSSARAQ